MSRCRLTLFDSNRRLFDRRSGKLAGAPADMLAAATGIGSEGSSWLWLRHNGHLQSLQPSARPLCAHESYKLWERVRKYIHMKRMFRTYSSYLFSFQSSCSNCSLICVVSSIKNTLGVWCKFPSLVALLPFEMEQNTLILLPSTCGPMRTYLYPASNFRGRAYIVSSPLETE